MVACKREATTTNSMQEGGIQIILLHVIEEIHVRIPNMYIGLRIIAGKPLKEFFDEVYEGMRNEASKMLNDTKKRIESTIQIDSDKGDTKLSEHIFHSNQLRSVPSEISNVSSFRKYLI